MKALPPNLKVIRPIQRSTTRNLPKHFHRRNLINQTRRRRPNKKMKRTRIPMRLRRRRRASRRRKSSNNN
jgi:hypothetical protein